MKPKMVPVSVITLEASEQMYRDMLRAQGVCGHDRIDSLLVPKDCRGLRTAHEIEGDAYALACLDHAIYGQPGIVLP